jgi:hypothetical protein
VAKKRMFCQQLEFDFLKYPACPGTKPTRRKLIACTIQHRGSNE